RFFVYTGSSLEAFCLQHATLYQQSVTPELLMQSKYESLRDMYKTVSHLIVACMVRTAITKIPAVEEYAAASAAVQNILIGATALNLASMWNTGGMTHSAALKQHLQLKEEDNILGLIYLGYADAIESAPPTRRIPLSEKVRWM